MGQSIRDLIALVSCRRMKTMHALMRLRAVA